MIIHLITPNLTFSTTIAPIYQLGLIPHFIGVEKNKFLADPSQIEKCINKKTVAIMVPNLLGNIANWKKISKIAKKYRLKVIEDSSVTVTVPTSVWFSSIEKTFGEVKTGGSTSKLVRVDI